MRFEIDYIITVGTCYGNKAIIKDRLLLEFEWDITVMKIDFEQVYLVYNNISPLGLSLQSPIQFIQKICNNIMNLRPKS